MNAIYYIGLDIHKKVIAYCIKRIDGTLVRQGTVASGVEFRGHNTWGGIPGT